MSLWNYFTISGLKQGYQIVSWDNGMFLKNIIILNFSKILLKFAFFTKIYQYLLPFSTTIPGQQNFSILGDWLFHRTFETKKLFWTFFTAKLNFFWILPFAVLFYMIFLLTRLENYKLQSRIQSWKNIPVSFSLRRLGFLSFSFSFTFYLSHSISLSLFVDASLQLLLCGVMSSLVLINNELK